MWYQNIRSALFGFVTKHGCDRQTDGPTDGQNYGFEDRAIVIVDLGYGSDILYMNSADHVLQTLRNAGDYRQPLLVCPAKISTN